MGCVLAACSVCMHFAMAQPSAQFVLHTGCNSCELACARLLPLTIQRECLCSSVQAHQRVVVNLTNEMSAASHEMMLAPPPAATQAAAQQALGAVNERVAAGPPAAQLPHETPQMLARPAHSAKACPDTLHTDDMNLATLPGFQAHKPYFMHKATPFPGVDNPINNHEGGLAPQHGKSQEQLEANLKEHINRVKLTMHVARSFENGKPLKYPRYPIGSLDLGEVIGKGAYGGVQAAYANDKNGRSFHAAVKFQELPEALTPEQIGQRVVEGVVGRTCFCDYIIYTHHCLFVPIFRIEQNQVGKVTDVTGFELAAEACKLHKKVSVKGYCIAQVMDLAEYGVL